MTLAQAIIYGTVDDVLKVITAGADVNEVDEYGYTPLIETAIVDNVAMAELLLKKGAQVNQTDMSGRTALHWAADNNNFELCELLLKNKANPNAYTLASQPVMVTPLLRGQKKLTDLLMEHGANIYFARDYINTKLLAHRYALQGVVDIVNHEGTFIEISYEGFFLEFTLNVVYYSLDRFIHHYSARHLRPFFPCLREVIDSIYKAAELIRYQQYNVDRKRYEQRMETLFAHPLLLLPVAYAGHAVTFVKYNNTWTHCDRGEYGRKNGCVNIFRLPNPTLINKDFCYRLLYEKHDEKFITERLDKILQVQPWQKIPMTPQVTGNCSWANVEASIPALLFAVLHSLSPREAEVKQKIDICLRIFREWMTWDQDQALDECIQSFRYSSPARQASKAALLGAILLQQCHYENFRNVKRAEKILKILMLPSYQYVLKSYLEAYCKPQMTPAGKNLLELLEDCGIDPKKLAF